jgi:hypothetical protein
MAKLIPKIIAVAQTPPPFHGQSVMNQFLLEGDYSKIRFYHVRMAFSDDIQEVGVFRWKKICHLVAVFFSIVDILLGENSNRDISSATVLSSPFM